MITTNSVSILLLFCAGLFDGIALAQQDVLPFMVGTALVFISGVIGKKETTKQ